MTRKGPKDRHLDFAAWLAGLAAKEDRGALAALRRGLLLDEEHLFELYGRLPPRFLAGLSAGEERLYLMVAALFAFHPATFADEELAARRRNLGDSLRYLALKKGGLHTAGEAEEGEPDDILPEPLKRRMEGLLSAPRQDVFGHLRQAISLLKAEQIEVDWAQLLSDLHAWEFPGRPVQWQWSRSFYVGHPDKEGDDDHVS